MARKKRTLEAPDEQPPATTITEPDMIWNPAGTGSAPPPPDGPSDDDPEAAELAELIAAIAAATSADSELEAIAPEDWSR